MKSALTTAAVFFGICFIYILLMLSGTENNFTYILDDAYIHLAMAKNYALHGVWGVTEYTFSSSSSSPFFTFVLSGLISVFGNNQLIPLFFNFGCAFLAVYLLNRYYSDFFKENRSIVLASVFTLLFASVHLLIFSGMEHVLQVLVVIINIYCFEKWRAFDFKNSSYTVGFYLTIALLGLIRFESIFYFAALAFVFLLLRKFKHSALLLMFGFVPILVFGYFTYQKTGYFFPNSVIVKGTKFDVSGNYLLQIKNIFLNKIVLKPYFYVAGLLPLCFVSFLIFKDYKNKLSFREMIANNFLLIALTINLFIQGAFGQFTNFFRYEAYLLTAFAMVIIPRIKNLFDNRNFLLKQSRVPVLLTLLTCMLLILKMAVGSMLIVIGSRNIYEQQVQSSEFLKKYYNSSKVIANDIGAICYFTDIHLLDVAGLGSKEMVPFKVKKKGLDDKFEHFLTQYSVQNHYQLAIIYEAWLEGHTPKNWKKVAVLEVKGLNAVLGLKQVTIYSIDPKIHSSLQQNVKNFNWNKNVDVKITE
ncbi:4-amino-4-deoxy-L-arabinose transferase-like glycosyltransferase [Chryseobacterium sp. 52]|uniref:hypothetical protein n=1 Tax=Chryseobacterium sp. 52 TaxID=2035213 RepID=UPI000C1A7B7C|nr:hypothetical protein [Chryseobacterium sp. 52]PIF43332.1 4-amino-4-deoxy-L-arabinose transferase-like glycosyltransferase [Chryseobacterium sp. 52]